MGTKDSHPQRHSQSMRYGNRVWNTQHLLLGREEGGRIGVRVSVCDKMTSKPAGPFNKEQLLLTIQF